MFFLGALTLVSTGPGVEIPNTMLGTSLRAELDVTPRIVSNSSPCCNNLSAKGCTGLVKVSGVGISIPRLFL